MVRRTLGDMTLVDRLTRAGATVHAALYRRFSSPRIRRIAGLPILLLTVKGRRSGKELTTPVCYLEVEGGYAVSGSAGGSDQEPQWFRNLRAAGDASVEVGSERRRVSVRVLQGAERDDVWQRFVSEGTTFDGYQHKTGRVIPVALLTPV